MLSRNGRNNQDREKITLRNPLNGELQYGGMMWDHREIEPGIVEERVTMTVRRWKMGEHGEALRQDVNHNCGGPWVIAHRNVPMSILLFFSRFARGERIDGSKR